MSPTNDDEWMRNMVDRVALDDEPDAAHMERLATEVLNAWADRAAPADAEPASAAPPRHRTPRLQYARLATAAVLAILLTGLWLLSNHAPGHSNGSALAQSIQALRTVQSVHMAGVDDAGEPFDCWIEPRNDGGALGRLRFETAAVTAVVCDGQVREYRPQINELRTLDSRSAPVLKAWQLVMDLRPWVGDTLLHEIQARANTWKESRGPDAQGRDCIFVDCSFAPLGLSFWFAFDAETKLIIQARQWANLDRSGPPKFEIRDVEYNVDLPASLFELEVPANARVLEAAGGDAQQALLNQAESLYEQKRYDDAIAVYLDLYDRYPQWYYAEHALMMVGICHGWLGDHEQAVAYYEKALREYPDLRGWSETTCFYLASEVARLGDREEAIRLLNKCIELCRGVRRPDAFPWREAQEALRAMEQPDTARVR
ncbi:MAG: tetratricopeptide repeat protein [Phycisphaerae bacterium]|nr:tetratricopeptide repeat protein [Phycisphaerae bacterium]